VFDGRPMLVRIHALVVRCGGETTSMPTGRAATGAPRHSAAGGILSPGFFVDSASEWRRRRDAEQRLIWPRCVYWHSTGGLAPMPLLPTLDHPIRAPQPRRHRRRDRGAAPRAFPRHRGPHLKGGALSVARKGANECQPDPSLTADDISMLNDAVAQIPT